MDWSLTQRTHLMVRYTQDSWKNNSPAAEETLWGDDPFPAVADIKGHMAFYADRVTVSATPRSTVQSCRRSPIDGVVHGERALDEFAC